MRNPKKASLRATLVFMTMLAFPAASLFAQSKTQTKSPVSARDADEKNFLILLDYYKKHPELYADVQAGSGRRIESFVDFDKRLLRRLGQEVWATRIRRFLNDYKNFSEQEKILINQVASLEKDMDSLPISEFDRRSLQEIKVASTNDKLAQTRRILIMLSVEANENIRDAIATLTPDQQIIVDLPERPKMPGIYGGSAFERQRMKEIDKLNLTPVDPEFYNSQLGKKLEKDLGGRAEFWSYNYDQDELFVKVAGDVGRLVVWTDPSGTRFIRTRVGSQFIEPKGRDEKVDMLNASGKFLTGESSAETLFGEFPLNTPSYQDERRQPHSGQHQREH